LLYGDVKEDPIATLISLDQQPLIFDPGKTIQISKKRCPRDVSKILENKKAVFTALREEGFIP